jgi:hypothetical protein
MCSELELEMIPKSSKETKIASGFHEFLSEELSGKRSDKFY